MRARLLLVLFAVVLLASVSTIGAGRSAGAPAGSSKTGCTCHGPEASGTPLALAGVEATYEPGTAYNLTVTVSGDLPGLLAQGGFALDSDPPGVLKATDGTTQVAADMATHTSAGAGHRAWTFRWTAPSRAGPVTIHYAGLAANGDGVPDPLDAWTTKTLKLDPAPSPTATASPAATSPGGQGVPGVGIVVVLALVVALVLRRRV